MKKHLLLVLALLEIGIMTLLIIFDILLPSLLILVIGTLFLLLRKEKPEFLNVKVWKKPLRFILSMAGLGLALAVFDYALVIPVLNHLTGTTQDMTSYADLKGNTGMLLFLLAYSWILAAVGEEIAYRGFFQNRILSLFANPVAGTIIAVLSTSVLFGLMHKEQGIAGMINTGLDAVIFSVIRYRFKSVWASALVHGFSNMVGIVTFFFTGPLNGLW